MPAAKTKSPFASTIIGMVLVAIAALSWSTAGLFTRVVTTDIPTTLFWRSVFGGAAVVLIFGFYHRPRRLSTLVTFTRDEVVLATVSGIAMCFFIAAFFYTSIANVSFVYGTSPLVTVILAWVLLKDRPQSITLMAAGLSGLGVAILAWGGQDFHDLMGLMLAGMMTLLMASIAVLAKYFPKADAGKAAYLSAVIAALAMLPFVSTFTLDGHNLIWLALYGVINIGLGFGVYLLGWRESRPQPRR